MFHDIVDDVFRWALVDDKPKILLDTLHTTNRDLYPAIYGIISILLTLLGAISNKREIFKWRVTREILLMVAYGRYTTVQLIHRHVQVNMDRIINNFVKRRNQRLQLSLTYTNEKL